MYGQKFLKGQIWWVGTKKSEVISGSIQTTNRPHVIVGNNIGNRNSPVLLVVPCTTEEKKPMPTHVEIEANGVKNTILCEQIKTINVNDMINYMFTLDDETIKKVDKALKFSLALDCDAIEENKQNFLLDYNIMNEVNEEIRSNKRGRIWDAKTKNEFVMYYEENGEKETAKKYNTKNNTKLYYKRFKDSLKEANK